MGRITRYVLAELLKVFAVTLTGMTGLMMLAGVGQEAIRQGLGPIPILRLLPYVLPNALLIAVPGTILFAACSVYGRMSSSNEVVAIKSLGMTPMSVVWPVLALSFVLSLVTVWLNDISMTWGKAGIHTVVVESVEQIAYSMLRNQRSYSTPRFSINVQRVDGRKLIRPTVIINASGDKPPITLTAQEAELRCAPEKEMLVVVLRDGAMEMGGKASLRFPDTFTHEVPLSEASKKGNTASGPSNFPMRQIPEEVIAETQRIEQLEQEMAALAAMQMTIGDFGSLTAYDWQRRQNELQQAHFRLSRLQTEPWRRWANGFSCFFFVLVGTPLAIRLRNSDLWTSFALCFLPILVVYYPLLMFGVDRAKIGALPPYAVWLGNAIMLVIGCYLLRQMQRN